MPTAGQAFSALSGLCGRACCWNRADQTAKPPCSGPAAMFFSAADGPVLPLSFSLAKADEIWPDQASVIDLHFGPQHRCEVYYRWRDVDDFALDEAISSCRRSVAIQKDAAAALRKQGFVTWGNGIPGHHCFRQLAIIEEKRGNLDDAISLCKEARKEGGLTIGISALPD